MQKKKDGKASFWCPKPGYSILFKMSSISFLVVTGLMKQNLDTVSQPLIDFHLVGVTRAKAAAWFV